MKSNFIRFNFLGKTFPCAITLSILAALPAAKAANIWASGAGTDNWDEANNYDNNTIPAVAQTLALAGGVETVNPKNIASSTTAGFLLLGAGQLRCRRRV